MKNNIAKIFLWTSILIYAVSLIVQSFGWRGWELLILGGDAFFHGDFYIPWLANPLIFLSWIFFKKLRFSLVLSLLAVILSGTFFFSSEKQGVEIVSIIWFSSMAIMLAGNIVRFIQSHKTAVK